MRHDTALTALFNPFDFIDSVRFRVVKPLNKPQIQFLRQHAKFVRHRYSKNYIPNYTLDLWTVVVPDKAAVLLLDSLGVMVNYVELARDYTGGDAARLHDLFDHCFYHPWHGKHETIIWYKGTTTMTGQRRAGHWFIWYSDKPSKITGEVECFHLEARYQGVAALRKIGINRARDLLKVDHTAYWQKHLHLLQEDRERLGRCWDNQRSRSRRSKPLIERFGPLSYNVDLAVGNVLFNASSFNPKQPQYRSVQYFISQFGRGPYLSPVQFSYDYVLKRKLLDIPLCRNDILPPSKHSDLSTLKPTVSLLSQRHPTHFRHSDRSQGSSHV